MTFGELLLGLDTQKKLFRAVNAITKPEKHRVSVKQSTELTERTDQRRARCRQFRIFSSCLIVKTLLHFSVMVDSLWQA